MSWWAFLRLPKARRKLAGLILNLLGILGILHLLVENHQLKKAAREWQEISNIYDGAIDQAIDELKARRRR